ncbi:cytochrome oxidase putative small subunit CydP [Neisseria sp. Ec49-e6-T10]|uniref:cytochrome oxidase putative small subunit CydP n=1 Tax=Neisseria sp. Ec49-e6-T10 TaxID=3140744 RepID=UPI003EBA950C
MNLVKQYRTEIIVTLIVKIIILTILWSLFFRHKQPVDPEKMDQHLLGHQHYSLYYGETHS